MSRVTKLFGYHEDMLLLDDDDALPELPDEEENLLVARLGSDGVRRIDESLRKHATDRWLKIARIVADSVNDGGFSLADENIVRLHLRRVAALVACGALEANGDLRKPRWSEVRTTRGSEIRR